MLKAREEYFLKRRKKNIKLKELANHICCSQALISLYETGKCDMSLEKLEKYRLYIENHKK